MADIDGILKMLQDAYQPFADETASVPKPLQLRVQLLDYFARSYIAAASVVAQHSPECWLPTAQLRGQAVELALKACLASAGAEPPRGHDLVDLCREAQRLGFALDDNQFAAIVHLHHLYSADLATGTKYKSRYPAEQNERLGRSVPSHAAYAAVVDTLLDQARQRRG